MQEQGQNARGWRCALQNLVSLWSGLDLRRRIFIVGATAAMFLAVLAMSRMANTPQMALLYAGLDARTAGDVVAALEQQGVAYKVQGDSIQVDAARRDQVRMTLAAEGLPAATGQGYELLDGLSGFGTTSQMFDAAYWRAKEGELARTILASPNITAARVHLAQAPSQPFQRDGQPTASVTVTTPAGSIPQAQARAIQHLVAAAVAGMRPEDVQVIDAVGGLVITGSNAPDPAAGGDARAREIEARVERLLGARVGPGKAVVQVSVDVETAREAITERTFDPQGRVAISSETEERSGNSSDPGGAVTVASNLPEGDAAGGAAGQSQTSETRERVNYEVSETSREVVRDPGSVRKLSVAVLIDVQTIVAADGTTTQEPRSDEELGVLRELVASAVGLDEARGDVLTLRSLPFEPVLAGGTLAEAGLFGSGPGIDIMAALQLGALALVVIVLGLFVVRPVLTAPQRRLSDLGSPSPLALPAFAAAGSGPRVLTGVIDDGADLPPLSVVSGPDGEDRPVDPVARLRRLIEERQSESVEILRGWMELEDEKS